MNELTKKKIKRGTMVKCRDVGYEDRYAYMFIRDACVESSYISAWSYSDLDGSEYAWSQCCLMGENRWFSGDQIEVVDEY